MTIAAPDRPRVNETVSARVRLQDSTIWSGLVLASALLLIAIVEWSLFHRCFTHHVAPSYPVGWDQIGVINRIYQLHFDWAKFGPAMFYPHNAWLFDKASMKGFISQLIGLIFTQMFGVSRLVAVSVNFAWFMVGEAAVFAYLYRRYHAPAAFCGIGLYLASFAHYVPIGGIFDMRLDYAAMVAVGIATIFVWEFVETGTRPNFLAASGALALCACTRSISIFYMIGALSALSAVLSCYRLFLPSAISVRNLSKRSFQITGSSFAVLCLFLCIYGKHFFKYYAERTLNGEAAMRTATYGLHGVGATILFNLENAFHLYGWLLGTAALIGVCLLGLTFSGHQKNNCRPWLLLVSTACLAASAFSLINFYTPSYHGMGVITVPLVCCLVGWLFSMCTFTDRKIWIPGIIAFTSGLFCFGWQMTHPNPSMVAPIDQSDLITDVQRRLIGHAKLRDRTQIAYVLETEGLQPANLLLQWYETQSIAPPENLQPVSVPVFQAISWPRLKEFIADDDFVVVPSFVSPLDNQTFRNLGQESVLSQLPRINQELSALYAHKEVLMDSDGDFEIVIYGH